MTDAARIWRDGLESWAIPAEVLAGAPESPFGFPVALFEKATMDAFDRETPSRRLARSAVPLGGTVLDVGCGAGAAGLPLAPPAAEVTGIDENEDMLAAFARAAEERGIRHTELCGRWPDVSPSVDPVDVVVCHHVVWNVPDLDAFAHALDDHARRRVVLEFTHDHPLRWMNPLWQEIHGIDRPDGPKASNAIAVLREVSSDVRVEHWDSPLRLHEADDHAALTFIGRRLCVGPDRDEDIRTALDHHPIPQTRRLVTAWWDIQA